MRKGNKKGDAMIVVLCIMTILVTLCLSMLLASSVLINNAQKKGFQEQCRVSASTMSKVLEEDLCTETVFEDDRPLFYYVQNGIGLDGKGGWTYYNPDEIGHGETTPSIYRNLKGSGFNDTTTGTVDMKLYWEWESNAQMKDIKLHVEVTAKKGGQQHTVFSVYALGIDSVTSKWIWSLEERH